MFHNIFHLFLIIGLCDNLEDTRFSFLRRQISEDKYVARSKEINAISRLAKSFRPCKANHFHRLPAGTNGLPTAYIEQNRLIP